MEFEIRAKRHEILCIVDGVERTIERRDLLNLIAQAANALAITEPDVVQIRQLDLSKDLPPDILDEINRRD